MKRLKKISLSLAVISALSFSGCGSSDDSTTTPTNDTQTVSGKVADGYLDKAKVCLDKNENGICDSSEPNTLSANGQYDLNITTSDIGKYPILVEVATTTVDLDDNLTISNGYTLTAPKDSTGFISPITTLIQNEIEKCPALTKDEATQRVSTKLNLTSTHTKLLTDYVANNSDSESSKLHEVGKVVAKLQGGLESKLTNSAILTSSNKKASMSQILDKVYTDINNTSAQIKNGTMASGINTTNMVTNINITSDDVAIATKSVDLLKTNKTTTMEELLSVPFYTFKHGKVDAVKLNDGKLYVGNSNIVDGAIGVNNISSNMKQVETYTKLSDGSFQLSNNSTTTFKRVSKLDANGKVFTLKEILTMMTEDNIPLYQKLENDGIAITQAKYDTKITFSSGDYMYLLILEQHNNGTFIDITYNLNNTAMAKVVEVLK